MTRKQQIMFLQNELGVPFEEWGAAEECINDTASQLDAKTSGLRATASALADHMLKLVARIDREGSSVHVNQLGEVQGYGVDVDRLCGEVVALRRQVDALVKVHKCVRARADEVSRG